MAKDRFLIAPFETGLQTDVRPWLIPDDAFQQLQNAYVFRGRVRKRPGSILQNLAAPVGAEQLYSRLAIKIATTAGDGSLPVTNIPGNVSKIGQVFSVGTSPAILKGLQTITVTGLGAPAGFITDSALVGIVINMTVGGANTITWAASPGYLGVDVYYYPAEPVMGLDQIDVNDINNEVTTGFDTQFGYRYINAHWELMGAMPSQAGAAQPAGAAMWTGSNSQFVWVTNWRGANDDTRTVYATNNKPLDTVAHATGYDGIKAYDVATNAWVNLSPVVTDAPNPNVTMIGALCLQVFKNCLFALNVWQRDTATNTDTQYPNMVRWSQRNANPLGATAWRQDASNSAGRLFIPTAEEITSVASVKDRLIVYCERSTWEIVFTGNQAQLFQAQRINSELGSESTFSPTLFDRAVLSIGNVGITACSGTSVERIDEKIPEDVFSISNINDAPIRVHGIRDYYTEAVYWTYPSGLNPFVFPDTILLYNYRNGTWAQLTDTVTCFGYDQNEDVPGGLAWINANIAWQFANFAWGNPAVKPRFLNVLAGNQQGVCFKFIQDFSFNADARYITAMDFGVPGQITIRCENHSLNVTDLAYIQINNASGVNMAALNETIFAIATIVDPNNFIINYAFPAGTTYTGSGTIVHVSIVGLTTKQYNLYQKDGYKCVIRKIDFNVNQEEAEGAQISVTYACDSNEDNLAAYPTILGPQAVIDLNMYDLYPNEEGAVQLWRSFYPNANGYYIQFTLGYSLAQMLDPNSAFSDFQLNAIMIYASPASSRLQ